jgi:hypothetical protein
VSVAIIQERLASYACRSTIAEEQALLEITQEIILAALGRTDFFAKAGFQGGTCLRVFHGLNRFSEDLDFALEALDRAFELSPYLGRVRQELTIYGYELEKDDRSKADAPRCCVGTISKVVIGMTFSGTPRARPPSITGCSRLPWIRSGRGKANPRRRMIPGASNNWVS